MESQSPDNLFQMTDMRGYINDRISKWNIQVSDTAFEVLLGIKGINETDQYNWTPAEVDRVAKVLLVEIIPELLMQPDVSEGGFSIKQNRDGILSYYNMLCAELGVPNRLAPSTPRITDRSSLW